MTIPDERVIYGEDGPHPALSARIEAMARTDGLCVLPRDLLFDLSLESADELLTEQASRMGEPIILVHPEAPSFFVFTPPEWSDQQRVEFLKTHGPSLEETYGRWPWCMRLNGDPEAAGLRIKRTK